MVVGEVVHGAGMTVTVLEVSSDGPRRARFEFDDALEAPGFLAIDDGRDGVKEARLPAIGFGAPFDF
jgi:hypothetical protein